MPAKEGCKPKVEMSSFVQFRNVAFGSPYRRLSWHHPSTGPECRGPVLGEGSGATAAQDRPPAASRVPPHPAATRSAALASHPRRQGWSGAGLWFGLDRCRSLAWLTRPRDLSR